ncbi:MAG: hypothetical protein J0I06_13690, partial [Planctomycetes bacterium]|nr:hypothetical protein [Planctomycetota bacterium]
MIVVKVGGSLFDHPKLGPGLRRYVESFAPAEVLLVAGGGPAADAVREWDRVHELGEEASHWLALQALDVTRALLESLCGEPTPPAPPFPSRRGESEPPRAANVVGS